VILRLSQTDNLTSESNGLHPAVAIKFLRDGTFAENIVATPNLTGSSSWNFFNEPMKTRLEPVDEEIHPIIAQTKQKKMVEASSRPFATAVGTIGATFPDGTELPQNNVNIPYELQFSSPYSFSNNKEYDSDGNQVMFYNQLKTITEGQTILEVYAMTAPPDADGELVKIADIVLLSDLYTSRFGDERLHFQHVRVWNDYRFWPRSWMWHTEDVHIAQTEENTWGRSVPAVWPETEEDAQAFYLE